MQRWKWMARIAAVLILGSTLFGCQHETASPPPAAGGSSSPSAKSEEEQIRESLAKLEETDRKSAEAQRVCVVTDARLGTMGAPVKVTVEGRDVWLCCAGCKGELESDTAKYLAKLNKDEKK